MSTTYSKTAEEHLSRDNATLAPTS